MFIPDRFKTNPFDKHIFKLEQLAEQIMQHRTVGNLDIDYTFGKEEREFIEEAVKLVRKAVGELKRMDRKKELLR